MLLFRALSTRDISNIDLGIYCSLIHSYSKLENSKIKGNEFGTKEYKSLSKSEKNIYDFFWNIFRNEHKISDSLDTIIGHVGGQTLKSGTSPWISTSTDFYFVAREYSIKQAGNYNTENNRKNIAFILYDNIYDSVSKIREIKDKVNNFSFAIDLRNDKLGEYYKEGVVGSIETNINLSNLSYKNIAKILSKDLLKYHPNLTGFYGYSTNASEIVINRKIESDKIVLIINPLLIDILYSFTNSIDYAKISKNYDDIKEFNKKS